MSAPGISGSNSSRRRLPHMVESRCGAVALGRTYLLPPLSSDGALVVQPWLRFHIPLIEPDMQISRIRLSGKTSSPYGTFAEECNRLAKEAQAERHRVVLKEMAEAWRKLAEEP